MLTVFIDVTPQGQYGIRYLGQCLGKAAFQVQGPGFIRVAESPEDLLRIEQGTAGGFMLDATMGVVQLDWDGPVYVVAGGQVVSAVNPLRVTVNYKLTNTAANTGPAPNISSGTFVGNIPSGYTPLGELMADLEEDFEFRGGNMLHLKCRTCNHQFDVEQPRKKGQAPHHEHPDDGGQLKPCGACGSDQLSAISSDSGRDDEVLALLTPAQKARLGL